jgi:hypothetical protein
MGFVCLLMVACHRQEPPSDGSGHGTVHSAQPLVPTNAPSGQVESRLLAAQGISDLGARDVALAEVAVIAASSNDAAHAITALRAISDLGIRDKAASKSALALANSGGRDEAVVVAKLISDLGVRDAVLSKVARD